MNRIVKSGLQSAGLVFGTVAIATGAGSLILLAYRAASVLGEGPGLLAGASMLVFLTVWGILYAAASE